jgi:hypothetical protein
VSFGQGARFKEQPGPFLIRPCQADDAEVRTLEFGCYLIIPTSSTWDVFLRHPWLDMLNNHGKPFTEPLATARLGSPLQEMKTRMIPSRLSREGTDGGHSAA